MAEKINLPENYVGTAFDREEEENTPVFSQEESEISESCGKESDISNIGRMFSIFKRIPGGEFLTGSLSKLHIKDFRIGTEEILILGISIFMLLPSLGLADSPEEMCGRSLQHGTSPRRNGSRTYRLR